MLHSQRRGVVAGRVIAVGLRRVAVDERAGGAVLSVRAKFPKATLVDLYDPLAMPPKLHKAHQQLDRAVDVAYGYKGSKDDASRVAFLFKLYQQYTSLLPGALKLKSRARSKGAK